MSNEKRIDNKCPRCNGNIGEYAGIIQCMDCDWKKEEERKNKIPTDLNEWKIKGGG